MRNLTLVMAAAAAFMAAPLASAASVTVSGTDGTWVNAVPLVTIDNVTTPRTARWGTSAGSGQSGYDYTASTVPFEAVVDGPNFLIGTFVHQNFPITGTTLNSIGLSFSLNWSGFAPDIAGLFSFTHEETPNAGLCPYGPANGTGVNINGCADRVTFSSPFLNTLISDGTSTYFFTMLGFSLDFGATTSSEFLTTEQLRNLAGLYGRLTSVRVPEPGSLALLGMGLLGLGLARRSKN